MVADGYPAATLGFRDHPSHELVHGIIIGIFGPMLENRKQIKLERKATVVIITDSYSCKPRFFRFIL